LGAEFAGLAVAAAVLAGLDRGETPDSLRRLIDGAGVGYDIEFIPNAPLRYASGVLRAAAGNHEAAVEELRTCAFDHPAYGGENPAMFPWRSAAALSLAELGRYDEAQVLADDEVQRAQSFGAPRAIGIALRAQALVGPRSQRSAGLAAALAVLEDSPGRLEHSRVLVDLGATLRAGVDDRAMVTALGININALFAVVFGLGAALAGLAGVIAAPLMSVYSQMGIGIVVETFVVVVVGGLGNLKGSFYASLIVGMTDAMSQAYLPQLDMFAVYALLIGVLIVRPEGLFRIVGRVA